MVKKITLDLWVEPLTDASNYNNFLDNIDEFIAAISRAGISNIGEDSFGLEIVDTNARRDD